VTTVVLVTSVVLMTSFVPSVTVTPPLPVMLAHVHVSRRPLDDAHIYGASAPTRACPNDYGEHKKQR
jgi:hypothetical protein